MDIWREYKYRYLMANGVTIDDSWARYVSIFIPIQSFFFLPLDIIFVHYISQQNV